MFGKTFLWKLRWRTKAADKLSDMAMGAWLRGRFVCAGRPVRVKSVVFSLMHVEMHVVEEEHSKKTPLKFVIRKIEKLSK